MTKTDHLVAEVKQLIEVAESDDPQATANEAIADKLIELIDGEGLTQREIAERVGKGQVWVNNLVQWRRAGVHDHEPHGGPKQDVAQSKSRAKKALRDPDIRRQVIADLAPADLEAVRSEATQAVVERARSQRKEHNTEPTARELTGAEPFDPAEFWADSVVIRVNNNARELASLIQRGGGLLFGAMDYEKAFEYLHEAERLIAEARAAAQEQVRDRVEVS